MPACKANQVARLNADRTAYTCDCIEGTFRTKDGQCQLFDICSEKDRQARGDRPVVPCADSGAECQYKGSGYECLCRADQYFNEGNIRSSAAVCIPKAMRDCSQGYQKVKNGTSYECTCNAGYQADGKGGCLAKPSVDVSRCTPVKENSSTSGKGPLPFLANDGKGCQCPPSFFFNSQSRTCEVDQSQAAKYGCEKLEIKSSDNKLGCVCAPGQKFDTVFRGCLFECDSAEVERCKHDHQAGCRFDVTSKKPSCECDSIKEIKLASTDAESSRSWKCASKCDTLLKNKKFQEKR